MTAAVAFVEPGTLDAYSFYHVAANLAAGRGFVEDLIWNYLPPPATITHPSNTYWTPLVSVAAAPGLLLLGPGFRAAQIPLVAVSAAVPAFTAYLALRFSASPFQATAAAGFALFSWYLFPHWVALDAFGLFALAGAAALLAAAALARDPGRWPALVLGVAAGAGHLARSDAPLLLLAALVVALPALLGRRRGPVARSFGLALAAYAVVMLPWFTRNLLVMGTPLPGGGLQAAFLREYNDLFSYGIPLDAAWLFGNGAGPVLQARIAAGLRNAAALFGLQYWLFPFAVAGWWALRRRTEAAAFLTYLLLLYGVMTLVFPFPGARGAMLHSSVALLPWLCVVTVFGIPAAVGWAAARLPHWDPVVATRRFTGVFLGVSVGASVALVLQQAPQRDPEVAAYRALATALYARDPAAVPLVNNPPGWWYATGRPALQVPSNGPAAAAAVAARYGGTHLVLQPARARAWLGFDGARAGLERIAGQGAYTAFAIAGRLTLLEAAGITEGGGP